MILLSGFKLVESLTMTVRGPDKIERRTWRERLFSLPWRPMQPSRTVITYQPDPNAQASQQPLTDEQIVAIYFSLFPTEFRNGLGEKAIRLARALFAAAKPVAAPLQRAEGAKQHARIDDMGCPCWKCIDERGGMSFNSQWMVLCPKCGNKRCPHAKDHRNDCTNSNEPGQKGSAYEDCPIAASGNQEDA